MATDVWGNTIHTKPKNRGESHEVDLRGYVFAAPLHAASTVPAWYGTYNTYIEAGEDLGFTNNKSQPINRLCKRV